MMGSLPSGETIPNSIDAQAWPVCSPAKKRLATASTSDSHGIVTAPGVCIRTTMGFLRDATAETSGPVHLSSKSVWFFMYESIGKLNPKPKSGIISLSSEFLSAPSPELIASLMMITSACEATSTAAARSSAQGCLA
eukprot:CAMPEP_0180550550 /NCGR_PEP_ID=MMETSP1036_2-20121128/72714_1 /TAXON_ID=632150 /ORGANISM="Azadinium spinosum, Strain 3D9" /LENGTH=136 /DNA_ID=CAMNT_0022565829 /DNA_START=94 /DNA_END=504 /DNA_ORIENTATION=+